MKNTCYLIFSIFIISCAQKESTDFDIESISGEWVHITELEGEKVIFNPCDEANRTFAVQEKEGDWKIIESAGQEAFIYTINLAKLEGSDLVITTLEDFSEEIIEFRLKNFSAEKNVLIWTLDKSPFDTEVEMVNSAERNNYPMVDEEC